MPTKRITLELPAMDNPALTRTFNLHLVPPPVAPVTGEVLICGQCDSSWRVASFVLDQITLAPFDDATSFAADSELEFCPRCGTAEQRRRGVRFYSPVATRAQLRSALREALRIADAANGTISDSSAIERRQKRIAELWKVLEDSTRSG